jgi:hypothetical protein
VGLDWLSAGVGAAIWELGKQAVGTFLKRKADSKDAKRKMVREDLERATALISDCVDAAVAYFTSTLMSSSRSTLAADVRRAVRELANKVHQVNLGLEALDAQPLDQHLMIRFRQAATMPLDDASHLPVAEDSALLGSVFRASHHFTAALTKQRFALT